MDGNGELKLLCKFKKIFFFRGGGRVGSGRGGVGLGGQGGCERRSKVFVKIQKKIEWGWVGVGGGWFVRSGVGVGEVVVVRFGVGG